MSDHDTFLGHLRESHKTVWLVARWLWAMGCNVYISKVREAKRHAEWKQFADDGDLYVFSDSGSRRRIEVKGSGADFTGPHDYPYHDMLVCAKHSYDNADPKPYAYVIVNKARTHAGIIKPGCWRVAGNGQAVFGKERNIRCLCLPA